jgi:hypothetical protein
MTRSLDEIEQDIRSLDPTDRDRLLRRLIADLDEGEPDAEADKLWLEEAHRRYEQYKRGEVESIPAEDVFRKIRDRLSDAS